MWPIFLSQGISNIFNISRIVELRVLMYYKEFVLAAQVVISFLWCIFVTFKAVLCEIVSMTE